MDDIGLLFSSSSGPRRRWKPTSGSSSPEGIEPTRQDRMSLATASGKKPRHPPPAVVAVNHEIHKVEAKRLDESASYSLNTERKAHQASKLRLHQRMAKVVAEQNDLKSNLGKFNTFVREKQLKAERGAAVEAEETLRTEEIVDEIRHKEQLQAELMRTKAFLEETVEKRKKFREFLQSVVQDEKSRNRYKDIGELMRRCETLVATRDSLTRMRNSIRSSISLEEEALAQFKEERNEKILELSARQNEVQEEHYSVEAKRAELQRLLEAEAKEKVNKQLLIANIRLSILTLWQYVFSRKVVLPSDLKGKRRRSPPEMPEEELPSKDKPPGIEEQLASVKAHIEDLEVVIKRVGLAADVDGYNMPLLSEFSELRIDF